MSMLKKKDLEKFSGRLKEEKAKILNNALKSKEDLAVNQEDLADEVDLASADLNQNMMLRLRDRERQLLHKIEVALAKIERGTFGYCDICQEPIEMKRLEARPIAELCIQCKEAQERNEKIYA